MVEIVFHTYWRS